jgi:branched-chain amino acid transport system ATP-binding protein
MTTTTSPLLSCRNVSKFFGAMAAVKDFSFDMAPGEVLGIGGPNGAGKTTLFELISGLNPADRGEILLEGREIQRLAPHAICHLGIVRMFQSNAGFDTLSARQNVLIAAAYGQKSPGLIPALVYDADIRRTADEAMEFVGFRGATDAQVKSLPVLDRKLLMIASALATKPKILMMDEPVGGLNPEEIDRLMALVRKLMAAGVTIMLIEHVMRFLVQLSTRVMIMHHGEKIYEGTPGGLAHDETVTRVYLGERMSKRIAGFAAKEGRE